MKIGKIIQGRRTIQRACLMFCLGLLYPLFLSAQINTNRMMMIGRNALYFEDYVLSIQYFNQVIGAKPYLYEPYFYRGLAKLNLEDYNGAEQDCSEALNRNPYVVGIYQVRGLARIYQNNFQGAINDYNRALVYAPENVGVWHNLVLCKMKQKDFQGALADLESLLTVSPRYVPAYLMRSEIYLNQQDTLKSEADVDYALTLDRFDADVWQTRALLRLGQNRYVEAEEDLNQALYLSPRNVRVYINRALARYHQQNLRGAMADYDSAIDIEPNNLIGRYNRGLLRAQVGDDNRAIEDFDKVIELEPDNMMALFNRGLLRDQVGDYKGAVSDYTSVLATYPDFMLGYHYRSAARLKIGDKKGSKEDEYRLMKAEIDRRNGGVAPDTISAKTRKQSDRNPNNYRKIVVADSEGVGQKYKNEYRGKVQNRNVEIDLEPMFVFTYYNENNEVKRAVAFCKISEELNGQGVLPKRLLLTNQEVALNQQQVQEHFASIDEVSARIVVEPKDARIRFARALDFYLVQDFASSIEDLNQTIDCDENFALAYFNRALVRSKQLEYQKAEASYEQSEEVSQTLKITNFSKQPKTLDYELVKADLDKVIDLLPDFEYGYYNRGNISSLLNDYHSAIVDYTKAIELNPQFAEAYYNRGLIQIFLGHNKEGLQDLSKAGELGIFSAYNIIKRFTETLE